jgi:hypothetical protein
MDQTFPRGYHAPPRIQPRPWTAEARGEKLCPSEAVERPWTASLCDVHKERGLEMAFVDVAPRL